MDLTDFDTLSNEEYDDKKRKERLDYLSRLPKYTKTDMIEFAKYYHKEADQFPPVSVDNILNDWEDEKAQ